MMPRAAVDPDRLVALYRETGSLNKAAAILGVSDRTLNRRRREDPDLARRLDEAKAAWRDSLPHGYSRYSAGCRCSVCRAGNAAMHRAWYRRAASSRAVSS